MSETADLDVDKAYRAACARLHMAKRAIEAAKIEHAAAKLECLKLEEEMFS